MNIDDLKARIAAAKRTISASVSPEHGCHEVIHYREDGAIWMTTSELQALVDELETLRAEVERLREAVEARRYGDW